MATEKNVQIPHTLFAEIFLYFTAPAYLRTQALEDKITAQLQDKFDRMYNHNLFTAYRNAGTDNPDRLTFLNEYLDRTGVSPDFRVLLRQDPPPEPDTENRPD